jgi:hypothetical protein
MTKRRRRTGYYLKTGQDLVDLDGLVVFISSGPQGTAAG